MANNDGYKDAPLADDKNIDSRTDGEVDDFGSSIDDLPMQPRG